MESPISSVIAGLFKPISHEAITVAGTAIGITSTLLSPTTGKKPVRAVLTVETADIRYRWDSGTPTSSVGHLAKAGDVIVLMGYKALSNFRAIRTGSSGTLMVTLEG